jgi:cellulose synthase (UDP-forming)
MSRLGALLLIPPVRARLSERYRNYRLHGASPFSAALGCLWVVLAWLFIPLEHPRWQRIRARHAELYPHINPDRPRPLDPARYAIQALWLLATPARREKSQPQKQSMARFKTLIGRYHQWLDHLPDRVRSNTSHLDSHKELGHLHPGLRRFILGVVIVFSLILALVCITQPFNPLAQFIFLILLWGVALLVRRIPGRFSALMLIVLSLTVSCRYIWWRYTSTLNWNDPVSLVCGLILLFAETYAWVVLVLGYFQVIWPLNRQPVPLPKDTRVWPSVDIFVPTYNEDLSVVKNTIYASLGIDWPKDKLQIWILDDGGREEFKQFADSVGVNYIARPTHEHAKAGNINNALKYAKGEFVSIFDCDHVPTRSFLQMTMGWFLKDKKTGHDADAAPLLLARPVRT